MKINCYIPGCDTFTTWSFMTYMFACFCTFSLNPFVCKDHYDLFEDAEKRDLYVSGYRNKKVEIGRRTD